tara:strand:- start:115 stop:657 length:543 start_codon:yes stop_codon:yes gene_type:complete
MIISYYTINDVVITYTDLDNALNIEIDYLPTVITYSLHSYHIINYYNKLVFDDWLHHILMCGIALPIGNFINSGTMLNHSLFFLTGVPGGINYLCLFLNRNGYILRITQKKINYYLNLWIRAPGCISHTAITIILAYKGKKIKYEFALILCTAILTFWNGMYFMDKVIRNYEVNRLKLKN